MVAIAAQEKIYTLAEYLAKEERAVYKHEFINGKIIKMPGGTVNHNLISTRITTELNNILDEKEQTYYVFNSDMKIYIPEFEHIVYPDALVVCEKLEHLGNSKSIILNPLLIVEVLSPSTARHDRSTKFLEYKTIPSFCEYVLVRQDKAHITVSFREKPNVWVDTFAENIEEKIFLKSLQCDLNLKKVYKGIIFE